METVQVDLLGNCFSKCLCDNFVEECSLRICSANEVGGQNNENSVYELYCRLNHSCCNNAVGQVVAHSEGGQAYQVGKDKVNDKDKINDNAVGQVVLHNEGRHCQAYQVGKESDKDKVNDKAVGQVLFHDEIGLVRWALRD